MVRAAVLLASTGSTETAAGRRVSRSDAAAVHAALGQSANAAAYCPAGDLVAAGFALAAGLRDVRVLSIAEIGDFDVLWIGCGVLEFADDRLPAQLAMSRKAGLIFDVLDCREGSGGWSVLRDAGRGVRDLLTVSGPAVLVVSENVSRPPYVSRTRRRLAASKLDAFRAASERIEQVEANSTRLWLPVKPRARVAKASPGGADDRMNSAFGIAQTAAAPANAIHIADPETCARLLLRYLRHHELIDPGIVPAGPELDAPLPDAGPVRQVPNAMRRAAAGNSPAAASFRVDPEMLRRPRQAGDSDERRRRQPRGCSNTERRPDVSTAIARQPRRLDADVVASRGPFPVRPSGP